MRINIASTHRPRLLDLAWELPQQGHDEVSYFLSGEDLSGFGLVQKMWPLRYKIADYMSIPTDHV